MFHLINGQLSHSLLFSDPNIENPAGKGTQLPAIVICKYM